LTLDELLKNGLTVDIVVYDMPPATCSQLGVSTRAVLQENLLGEGIGPPN